MSFSSHEIIYGKKQMKAVRSSSSQNGIIAKAVVATALASLVLAGILFYFFHSFSMTRKHKKGKLASSFRRDDAVIPSQEFGLLEGNVKGLLVDENGLDVLYLRRHERGQLTSSFSKVWFNPMVEDEKKIDIEGDSKPMLSKPVQEFSVLHETFNTVDSENPMKLATPFTNPLFTSVDLMQTKPAKTLQSSPFTTCPMTSIKHTSSPPSPPQTPPPSLPMHPPSQLTEKRIPRPPCARIQTKRNLPLLYEPFNNVNTEDLKKAIPPPSTNSLSKMFDLTALQPLPTKPLHQQPLTASPITLMKQSSSSSSSSSSSLPPPSPPHLPLPPQPQLSEKRIPQPPPPPNQIKRNPDRMSIPFKASLVLQDKPPIEPIGEVNNNSKAEPPVEESSKEEKETILRLKPLHWDKVITNAEQSMVWDEINAGGSLRFDEGLLESLFGYNRQNQKYPKRNTASTSNDHISALTAPIFILDPRKSHNTEIVLKSLAISREEILDYLLESQEIYADTLEKLTNISPTQEEVNKILKFNGDTRKLAYAESFLYYILKAVPSAFIRFDALLFRSNYDPEILHIRESLKTLEFGCEELKRRGIFLKLLEAILKAGNIMNAGTARGNAKGFNLNVLRKISQVTSTDGRTTLLSVVVEQVVHSEGKKRFMNQNHKPGRTNNQYYTKSKDTNNQTENEDKQRQYLILGLPALRGLDVDFCNVKKAASIDYDVFINMPSILTRRIAAIRKLITHCGSEEIYDRFFTDMRGFLEECELELDVVRDEQMRMIELVKRTTEYYQGGASDDNVADPLQLFAIVKDFLEVVCHTCTEMTRDLEKRKITMVESSPPLSPSRSPARTPHWHSYFMVEKHEISSCSESDDF